MYWNCMEDNILYIITSTYTVTTITPAELRLLSNANSLMKVLCIT